MRRYLLILLLISLNSFSYEMPTYTIKNFGILDADLSTAIAINNKNQILGEFTVGNECYRFLWSEENGPHLIDVPKGSMFLNDKGQIAGVESRKENSEYVYDIFIWDEVEGLRTVYSSMHNYIQLIKFNNNGQLLFKTHPIPTLNGALEYFIWDSSKQSLTNLSETFKAKFSEPFIYFLHVALNNSGDIAIVSKVGSGKYRSYLWRNNILVQLSLGFDIDIELVIQDIDDNGNIIATAINGPYGKTFFINECKLIKSEMKGFSYNQFLLLNGLPMELGCTPSVLKKDFEGVNYYIPGAEIKKLITNKDSFWNGAISIFAQNDQGYAIGEGETIFFGQKQAILLVPNKIDSR